MNKWNDQDIDNLLASVEETLEKAESLAKSASLSKAGDEDKDKPAPTEDAGAAAPAQDAPPAEAAPAAADAAPAPAADAGAAPAPGADAAAGAAGGDQALQGEAAEDQPLSDEELSQIYGSMPPEELERHYSVVRQALQAAYGSDQQAAAGAPAPEAAGAAAPPPAAPAPAAPEMEKSEKLAALEARVAQQDQALETITKAFEALAKPQRKSITEIQVMNKSEADAGAGSNRPMSDGEIKEAARKLNPSSLSKSERELVNGLFLRGEGAKEVEKLINSKGGK